MSSPQSAELASQLFPAVLSAGAALMRHFENGVLMELKPDGSPVSAADREAEAILTEQLARIAPNVPIVAEERASSEMPADVGDTFFLVDPLDGTREFASRRPEFTINVALIVKGQPIFGAIYAPALGMLYWTEGTREAFKAQVCKHNPIATMADLDKTRLACSRAPGRELIVVASRSHNSPATEAWLCGFNISSRVDLGSSLKFCLIAEGKADVYPRLGPTMEWDTAAGHAILAAAGGCVIDVLGSPLTYGKAAGAWRNPGFIAWGRPHTDTMRPNHT